MSKAMNIRHGRIRWKLLVTASSIALMAQGILAKQVEAAASDAAGRPPLWLEFGWQYAHASDSEEFLSPPFFDSITQAGFTSPLQAEKAIGWAYGGDASISFAPEDTGLTFSASVRYGRAHGRHHLHEQTNDVRRVLIAGSKYETLDPLVVDFEDTKASNSQTHLIADFQVGKDIGIGAFGSNGTSNFSLGVRYAQFHLHDHANVYAIPDYYVPVPPHSILKYPFHQHNYHASADIQRTFRGIGPSLSWDASAALVGDLSDGEISLDWGANAAVLFGRQTMRGHHQTTGHYYYRKAFPLNQFASQYHNAGNPDRSRRVTVPNLGGFAGVSYRFTNAKLSLGYRGDFFFGAMDGGIDTRKSMTRGFFGPYASISVGIGD